MEERRRAKRYTVSFPVALESHGGGRYVFSTRVRNVAARGLLVMMAAELEVGEPVEITYTVEGREIFYHDLEGRIVRVEQNQGDGQEEWPYLAAVEFTGALPHLDDFLGFEPKNDGAETPTNKENVASETANEDKGREEIADGDSGENENAAETVADETTSSVASEGDESEDNESEDDEPGNDASEGDESENAEPDIDEQKTPS